MKTAAAIENMEKRFGINRRRRLVRMEKAKRRNPADTTMRNIRALKKQVKAIRISIAGLDANLILLCERVERLETPKNA